MAFIASSAEKVSHTNVPEFVCSDIEADAQLAFHIAVLGDLGKAQNVVVRVSDTNVMIILQLSYQTCYYECLAGCRSLKY